MNASGIRKQTAGATKTHPSKEVPVKDELLIQIEIQSVFVSIRNVIYLNC